jgi:hypothetical protein
MSQQRGAKRIETVNEEEEVSVWTNECDAREETHVGGTEKERRWRWVACGERLLHDHV